MDCNKATELIPDYVVDNLSAEERSRLMLHLDSGCQRCADKVSEAMQALNLLAESLEPVAPNPQLKESLLNRIANEPQLPAAKLTLPPRIYTDASEATAAWKVYFPYAAATVVAIAAGSLLANFARLGTIFDGSGEAVRITQQWQQSIEAAERAFGAPRASLVGYGGNLTDQQFQAAVFYDGLAHQLHILASRVTPPPQGQTLWLWLLDDQGAVLSGSRLEYLGRQRAATVLDLPELPHNIAEAIITHELQADASEPAGPIVDRARLKPTP